MQTKGRITFNSTYACACTHNYYVSGVVSGLACVLLSFFYVMKGKGGTMTKEMVNETIKLIPPCKISFPLKLSAILVVTEKLTLLTPLFLCRYCILWMFTLILEDMHEEMHSSHCAYTYAQLTSSIMIDVNVDLRLWCFQIDLAFLIILIIASSDRCSCWVCLCPLSLLGRKGREEEWESKEV